MNIAERPLTSTSPIAASYPAKQAGLFDSSLRRFTRTFYSNLLPLAISVLPKSARRDAFQRYTQLLHDQEPEIDEAPVGRPLGLQVGSISTCCFGRTLGDRARERSGNEA